MESAVDPLEAIVSSHLATMKTLGEKDRKLTEESGATLMTAIRNASGVRKQVVDKALAVLGINKPEPATSPDEKPQES